MSSLSLLSRRHVLLGLSVGLPLIASQAQAASAAKISRDARAALNALYASHPKAAEYGRQAKAVLVFPEIVKAGAMIGGETGSGAMLEPTRVTGFYNISAASFGLQLGAQKFGYALFFMNDKAVDYLRKSDGWSVGSGPSVVVVDQGFAKSTNTTTLTEDVYAIAFNQRGLMAGAGLEGSKITPIHPDP